MAVMLSLRGHEDQLTRAKDASASATAGDSAATARTTSPTTITAGLPSDAAATVAASASSRQTACRCDGRLACWTIATGVAGGKAASSPIWMAAALAMPM